MYLLQIKYLSMLLLAARQKKNIYSYYKQTKKNIIFSELDILSADGGTPKVRVGFLSYRSRTLNSV